MSSRVRALAIAAVLTICAACSGETAPVVGPSNQPTPLPGAKSPIEQLFGQDADVAEAYFEVFQRDIQEKIQACMANAGFEFFVSTQFQVGVLVNGTQTASSQPTNRGEASRRGLGLLVDEQGADQVAPTPSIPDPNSEYQGSLSDREFNSYQASLYGPEGCAQSSQNEVLKAQPSGGNSYLNEFSDDLQVMRERESADPRVIAVEEGWSSCLTAEGFAASSYESAIDSYMQDIEQSGFFSEEGASSEDLAKLENYERDLAGAIWHCDQELLNVRRTVRFELEQAFVEENEVRLLEIFAANR